MNRSRFGLIFRTLILTALCASSLHLIADEEKKELKDLKLALSKGLTGVDPSLASKESKKESISSDEDLSQCGGGCSLYRTGPAPGRNGSCSPNLFQQYGPHGQVIAHPLPATPKEPQMIGPGIHEPVRPVTPNLQVPTQSGRTVTVYTENQQGYTINFENIPVIELIRFISQITNTNFIFDSKDIPFSITIVSEDQMTVAEVMASLLQVLRMNGLSVTEQGNNVIIYNNQSVSRVSTIVTDENAYAVIPDSAVITRVFRLYNVIPERIAQIVAPLLSKDALVEVSQETRHLIVTDITANVEKIAELLQALDVPDGTVDVGQYFVKNSFPDLLISIANRILAPLANQQIFNLVPQVSTNSIFIVSTPYLINKALALFASLDVAPTMSPDVIAAQLPTISSIDMPSDAMVNTNFYVYKLLYHNGQEIADALRDIGASLQFSGLANIDLVSAINSMQWIVANNSLVFSGTDAAIEKIKELLRDLDVLPKQVYIEVLIIDTTISNSLNFGVEWVALGRENNVAYATGFIPNDGAGFIQGARNAFNSPPPSPARGGSAGTGGTGGGVCGGGVCGDIPLSAGFNLGVVGNLIRHNGVPYLTLAALLKALEGESETVIVLNPRIMTEDTKEANVFVGRNIPYQTTSVVQKDTGTVTSNFQYEDIGVQLRVTPIVGANGIVTLEIDQSISDVTQSQVDSGSTSGSIGPTVLLTPTTTKTLTSTRVHVPDGAFLVMSGMMRDISTYARTGIPCLGTLPYIGPTFSNTIETREKRNLIIFVKPRIVSTSMMGIELTNDEGCLYNFESHPCSIKECGTWRAPECEELHLPPCH